MYYDLLVQIKNAEAVRKPLIRVKFSKVDFGIAKILLESGYIKDVKKKNLGRKTFLEITLPQKEEFNGYKKIEGFKFFSKPSRRFYIGYRDIKLPKQGRGVAVISTSRGIMTSAEAKKRKLGGEYLFELW